MSSKHGEWESAVDSTPAIVRTTTATPHHIQSPIQFLDLHLPSMHLSCTSCIVPAGNGACSWPLTGLKTHLAFAVVKIGGVQQFAGTWKISVWWDQEGQIVQCWILLKSTNVNSRCVGARSVGNSKIYQSNSISSISTADLVVVLVPRQPTCPLERHSSSYSLAEQRATLTRSHNRCHLKRRVQHYLFTATNFRNRVHETLVARHRGTRCI